MEGATLSPAFSTHGVSEALHKALHGYDPYDVPPGSVTCSPLLLQWHLLLHQWGLDTSVVVQVALAVFLHACFVGLCYSLAKAMFQASKEQLPLLAGESVNFQKPKEDWWWFRWGPMAVAAISLLHPAILLPFPSFGKTVFLLLLVSSGCALAKGYTSIAAFSLGGVAAISGNLAFLWLLGSVVARHLQQQGTTAPLILKCCSSTVLVIIAFIPSIAAVAFAPNAATVLQSFFAHYSFGHTYDISPNPVWQFLGLAFLPFVPYYSLLVKSLPLFICPIIIAAFRSFPLTQWTVVLGSLVICGSFTSLADYAVALVFLLGHPTLLYDLPSIRVKSAIHFTTMLGIICMHSLWIEARMGNSNFHFNQVLLCNLSGGLILTDFVARAHPRNFTLK